MSVCVCMCVWGEERRGEAWVERERCKPGPARLDSACTMMIICKTKILHSTIFTITAFNNKWENYYKFFLFFFLLGSVFGFQSWEELGQVSEWVSWEGDEGMVWCGVTSACRRYNSSLSLCFAKLGIINVQLLNLTRPIEAIEVLMGVWFDGQAI